jgi:hypothetical protein
MRHAGVTQLLLNSIEIRHSNGKPECSGKCLNLGELKLVAGGEISERGIASSVQNPFFILHVSVQFSSRQQPPLQVFMHFLR